MQNEDKRFILVGLGNPGKEYDSTRHNIGFMAADRIISSYGFSDPSKKFNALFSEGTIGENKIYLVKPNTYMNRSGVCLQEVKKFYKIPIGNIIVIHDDLDLVVGKVRIKIGGGAGGHNGLKSLDSHIGKNYKRVRVGIDHPGDKNKVESYVLKKFPAKDKKITENVLDIVTECFPLILGGEDEKFMTKVALLANK